MRFLTTVLILSVAALVTADTDIDTYIGDHCTVTNVFKHDNPFEDKNVIYMKVLNDCDNGTVWWSYPEGTALINATRPGQDFEFCIEASRHSKMGGFELKSNVAKGPLLVPTKDNPTCIRSLQGEAAFIIQAPPRNYYLTRFNYRVASPVLA